MRRPAPVTIATVAVAALLVWYVIYTQGVVRELRREASRVGLMYARVYDGLNDPNPDAANSTLLDLARHIRESGVPLVLTDTRGNPTDTANLPMSASLNSPELKEYVRRWTCRIVQLSRGTSERFTTETRHSFADYESFRSCSHS